LHRPCDLPLRIDSCDVRHARSASPEDFGVTPSTIKHLASATPAGHRRFGSREIREAALQAA
jgi:hypothetical protein